MAIFEYEGLNRARERQQGVVEAATQEEAVEIIKRLGVFPTRLREQKDEKPDTAGGVNRAASKGFPKQ